MHLFVIGEEEVESTKCLLCKQWSHPIKTPYIDKLYGQQF